MKLSNHDIAVLQFPPREQHDPGNASERSAEGASSTRLQAHHVFPSAPTGEVTHRGASPWISFAFILGVNANL